MLALLTLLALTTADARELPLTLQVTDAEGAPIGTAEVRFAAEGDQRHRVHAETGAWKAIELWAPGQTQIPFTPGMKLAVEVIAPGYALHARELELQKKGNEVQVVLSPLDMKVDEVPVEVPADAQEAAQRAERLQAAALELQALSAVARWKEAAAAYVASPSEDAARAAREARLATARAALAWLEHLRDAGVDPSEAHALCRAAEDRPARCE